MREPWWTHHRARAGDDVAGPEQELECFDGPARVLTWRVTGDRACSPDRCLELAGLTSFDVSGQSQARGLGEAGPRGKRSRVPMFPEVELHFAETSVTLRCRRDEDFTALLAACEHALQWWRHWLARTGRAMQ